MSKRPKIKRPAFRYPGSKWRLAEWIISLLPQHRVFVELFGGSGAVSLRKTPARTDVLNDTYDEVVNLFQVLRDPERNQLLRFQLLNTPYSRTEFENCRTGRGRTKVERARRFIVLVSFAHHPGKSMRREKNGFRSSSNQHQDLARSFRSYIDNLEAIGQRLQEMVIENRDWLKLLRQHWYEDGCIYADPPYIGDSRRHKRKVYQHEMRTEQQHYKLLYELHQYPGFVLVSAYDHPIYNQLDHWGWTRVSSKAWVGGTAQGKAMSSEEVIWLNERAADHQRQLKMFR